ncbi:MAG TPA: acyl-CoA reductase [Longimicrobiales bacterium]|nr:acyl-CoA reductase [Longimicrobiales bacterium]
MTLDLFHLPGLRDDDVAGWEVGEAAPGAAPIRWPRLRPQGLRRLMTGLVAARERHLLECRTGSLVAALDAAAARLEDAGSPEGALARSALPALTGYSPPMAEWVIERTCADWRAAALWRLLKAEFPDPSVLESFRPSGDEDQGPRRRAMGPRLAFHVFAGNVPGVAVTSLIRSLLVRSATLGKTASGEPLLAPLFARALAGVDPALGACVAATYWPGGASELEAVALDGADTIIVYGGAEAVADLRARAPATTRFVEHGPRVSFGMVGQGALEPQGLDALLADVALAVATFDQHGCVSPHVVYVEKGGAVAPPVFAGLLAEALGRLEEELPRGRISAAEAAAVHQARAAAEFRAGPGGRGEVFAGPGTAYTVIYDPDPALELSCLNRVVRVKPLERLEEVVDRLGVLRGMVQTVAVAGAGGRLAGLAELLGRAGVSRVTDFRRMPWPPPEWRHDGTEPLRELVRWTELED